MASAKPSQDPTWAVDTSLPPCPCGGALECADEKRKENNIFDDFLFLKFHCSEISAAGKAGPKPPPPSPHTPGIRLNIVSIFLTASQSLNINLPVIGGENKQAIKNVTGLTFSFLGLALPFHFAPTA